MNAIDFFEDAEAAAAYVTLRAADAAKLLNELHWASGRMSGVLHAEIYGHSILWDVKGTALHAFRTEYEILPCGAEDYALGNLQQILAFVLAKNW